MNIYHLVYIPWYIFFAYWAVSALRTKSTKVHEDLPGRLLHVVMLTIAFLLVFYLEMNLGPLDRRFRPPSKPAWEVGVALSFLGIALAIWARYCIGQNWSGRVTLKVDHQLIRSGPYAYVRHPIYTGLLVALAGSVLSFAEWRCLLGFVIAVLEFSRKARKEEALLTSEFGDRYQEYRGETGFLIPRFR